MAEHSIRVRPRDGVSVAFYAPAADITHGMKGVVRAALRVFDSRGDNSRVLRMLESLKDFQNGAVLSRNRWEAEGLEGLDKVLDPLTDEERGMFLTAFFRAVMDFYWHSMRLTTESPETRVEEMAEALNVSEALRNMPGKLRREYLEHMRDCNKLPPVLDMKCLFERKGGGDAERS